MATVPEVMRNLPAGLPDDAQRQIAEQQVAASNEMLLPEAAKANIDRMLAKQCTFNRNFTQASWSAVSPSLHWWR